MSDDALSTRLKTHAGAYVISGLTYDQAQAIGAAVDSIAEANGVPWHKLDYNDLLIAATDPDNALHAVVVWDESLKHPPLEQLKRLVGSIEQLC